MARVRSSEKRQAILRAAVQEIAGNGLGAATAEIAKQAGIAAGTLFTYFASKDELLNELYLELKSDVITRVNTGFPKRGSLERRARHIWTSYMEWAIAFPDKRKVSAQLNVSNAITPETRAKTAAGREAIEATLRELDSREALQGLPAGFAAAAMAAMREVTMEFIGKQPKRRAELMEQGFRVFWRAMQ